MRWSFFLRFSLNFGLNSLICNNYFTLFSFTLFCIYNVVRERNMRILLSLTEKCNLRCSYCYYKKSQEERCAEMSDEVREAALRFALDKTIEFKQNALALTFFGGEPLLCFYAIRKSVDFLKENVQRRRSELP